MKKGDPGYKKWRENIGRPKALDSPEQLFDAANEYFTWCDKNPLYKLEAIKSGPFAGDLIDIPCTRPYLWQGLERHLRDAGLIAKLDDYRSNKEGRYADFADTIAYITDIIREQKYSNALVGNFHAGLIASDLGMSTKNETTLISEQPLFPDVKKP